MPQSLQIAERLLAHARLCRQIAHASSNEATAAELEQLADECVRAAAVAAANAGPARQIH